MTKHYWEKIQEQRASDLSKGDIAWDNANGHKHTGGTNDASQVDHTDLTGTSGDVHPQYVHTSKGSEQTVQDGLKVQSGFNVDGTDMSLTNGATITGLPSTPSSGNEATSKDYVDSVVQGVEWQDSAST